MVLYADKEGAFCPALPDLLCQCNMQKYVKCHLIFVIQADYVHNFTSICSQHYLLSKMPHCFFQKRFTFYKVDFFSAAGSHALPGPVHASAPLGAPRARRALLKGRYGSSGYGAELPFLKSALVESSSVKQQVVS